MAAIPRSAIGSLISEARNAKGWTQSRLAHAAGTTQSRVAELEGSGGNPTMGTIAHVARVLDFAANSVSARAITHRAYP
jgi:transcriptional regulator with XRE-family HTH domain